MPAWYSGVYDRDRVLGVGSLCTPYFTPGEVDVVEIYDTLRGPKHYMRTFQEPPYAEELLGRDVEHTFRSLMRGRGYTLEQFKQAPREVQELPAGWFVGDPQLFGEEILTDDWALPVDFTEGMENLLPQLEKHVIADAAHWLQQEKPEEVSELLLGWLRRNF